MDDNIRFLFKRIILWLQENIACVALGSNHSTLSIRHQCFVHPRSLLICAQSCKNKERGHNKNDVGSTKLNSLTLALLLHNQTVKEQAVSFTPNNT